MTAEPVDRRPLGSAVVLRVGESSCELWDGAGVISASYAPQFPTPRVERVSPGHLVAVAQAPDARRVVLWRWYDAVVLEHAASGEVRLWEPAHGEVVASARPGCPVLVPGSRAYASSGLPGAEWWVAAPVPPSPGPAGVELGEVLALYVDNGGWDPALA